MFKIKKVSAREILDSRGYPTVEVEVLLNNNRKAWLGVPSGVSTGSHEAWELRDNDKKRYQGKGVLKAVNNVNKIIAPKLIGKDPYDQEEIDELMIKLDGTKNKSKLGANAILGVSLVVARAAAISQGLPLYQYLRKRFFSDLQNWNFPVPMMNILNGGSHAGFSLDIQEFMILPQQQSVQKRVQCGAEIFHNLRNYLKNKNYPSTVADEGGYAPKLKNNEEGLKIILTIIKQAGYTFTDVKLGIDVAASQFYNKKKKVSFKIRQKGIISQAINQDVSRLGTKISNNFP